MCYNYIIKLIGNKDMKNVLVNGGSRGIGREIVRLFSEKGYNVMFTYSKIYSAKYDVRLTESGLRFYGKG